MSCICEGGKHVVRQGVEYRWTMGRDENGPHIIHVTQTLSGDKLMHVDWMPVRYCPKCGKEL